MTKPVNPTGTELQRQVSREARLGLEREWRETYCRLSGLPAYAFSDVWWHGTDAAGGDEQYRKLAPGRRFVWDFVHRSLPIAIEVNGGQGRGGRSGHGSWTGLARDAEKALQAVLAGYFPVTFVTSQVMGQDGLRQFEDLLALERRLEDIIQSRQTLQVAGQGSTGFVAIAPVDAHDARPPGVQALDVEDGPDGPRPAAARVRRA